MPLEAILNRIRDLESPNYLLKEDLRLIGALLTYEFLKEGGAFKERKIKTWKGLRSFKLLEEDQYVLIGILRAGLPMVEGASLILRNSKVGFLGIRRDEKTLKPTLYYSKVPKGEGKSFLIYDPMLATGGTISLAVNYLKNFKPKELVCFHLIASEEGLKKLKELKVKYYLVKGDEKLEKGFIVPGVGDLGDRLFGT